VELQVIEKMTGIVTEFLGNKEIEGFAKAYHLATAIEGLRELLTPEYMAPIMKLQGTKLGFRTDKDRAKGNDKPGYPMEVVRECLIEAVLFGVQPVGNQFNIIAGGAYITKEGYGYLLKNIPNLSWLISSGIPRKVGSNGAVLMNVEFTYNGVKRTQPLDIAVKIDDYSSTDQVSGKAERKARYWLHKTVTGSETPEGDVLDIDAISVKTVPQGDPIVLDDLITLYDAKKPLLTADEVERAQQIIKNNETASFKKLKTLLDGKQ
jgi:hypothetical protein